MGQEEIHRLVRKVQLVLCRERGEIEHGRLPPSYRQREAAQVEFRPFEGRHQKEHGKVVGFFLWHDTPDNQFELTVFHSLRYCCNQVACSMILSSKRSNLEMS